MELARLSHERERLCAEMAHWERRIERIKRRLGEIARAEEWLRGFADRAEASLDQQQVGSTLEGTPAAASSELHEITIQY